MPFTTLPPELHLDIASFLPPSSLLSLILTSRTLHVLLTPLLRYHAPSPSYATAAFFVAILTLNTPLLHRIFSFSSITVIRLSQLPTSNNKTPEVYFSSPGVCSDEKMAWMLSQGTNILLQREIKDPLRNVYYGPLLWAVENEHKGLLRVVLHALDATTSSNAGRYGVPPSAPGCFDALLTAARYATPSVTEQILAYVTRTHGGEAGRSAAGHALMLSVMAQRVELVKAALGCGADPDVSVEAIRVSYQGGIRGKGFTVLMWAMNTNGVDIVNALLDGGADIHSRAEDGMTVLMVGAYSAEKLKLLLERGAWEDVNLQDSQGRTVLHYVVLSSDCFVGTWGGIGGGGAMGDVEKSVRLLVEAGADVKMRDGEGRTALDVFVQRSGQVVLLERERPTAVEWRVMKLLERNRVREKVVRLVARVGRRIGIGRG